MSNHLELMLEALKWANGALIHIDTPTIKGRIAEAIAAGEAELAREPDAWVYVPSGEPVDGIPEEFLCPTAHMAEPIPEGNDKVIPVWTREEIK